MVEALVGQIQQLRGMLLGQHVDGDPELLLAGCQLDLVMGSVGPTLGPSVDHPPGQYPISRQRHACPSNGPAA
jgi:hypothetical protein